MNAENADFKGFYLRKSALVRVPSEIQRITDKLYYIPGAYGTVIKNIFKAPATRRGSSSMTM